MGQEVTGYPYYFYSKALDSNWLVQNKVNLVVIAIQGIGPIRRNEISEAVIKAGVKVKVVPSYRTWIDGNLTANNSNP